MPARQRPIWDVRGSTILLSTDRDRLAQFPFHARCYDDGHGSIQVNGIWLPIPAEMSAVVFLDMVWSHALGQPGRRLASGD